MLKIGLIGTGRLAHNLFHIFKDRPEVSIIHILGRDPKKLEAYKDKVRTGPMEAITEEVDIYIIAISDNSLYSVYQYIKNNNILIAHTSGSAPLNALPAEVRRGVFYPLQTFSFGEPVSFRNIPICLEAENQEDLESLRQLGSLISDSVHEVSSKDRERLHLAAVLVNNFVNHLFYLGQEICRDARLPEGILNALIQETAGKLKNMSAFDAQTGPARRGDIKTMEGHLDLIHDPQLQEIYRQMSASIRNTYGDEL